MRPVALLALAALLALPTASAGFRLVAYCDDGACPGVAGGNRTDGCDASSLVGTCQYSGPDGTGAGVWLGVEPCADPYCVDVAAGKCVRVATNVVTNACAIRLHYSGDDLLCAVFARPPTHECDP